MKRTVYILFLLALTACDRTRNNPGWDYFPDMFYSTAYETYSYNPNFDNGMTMRVPPEGAISRDFIPFQYDASVESRTKAGEELVNPFTPSPGMLDRGKAEYTTFCAICHGDGGRGDGRIYKLGLYPMKPRPVAGPDARPLRDGEIYHTITLGFGSMGAYGSQVEPDDRWKIVLYIRQLQSAVTDTTNTNK
jgi:mono/diheme cytochrome c family protein